MTCPTCWNCSRPVRPGEPAECHLEERADKSFEMVVYHVDCDASVRQGARLLLAVLRQCRVVVARRVAA